MPDEWKTKENFKKGKPHLYIKLIEAHTLFNEKKYPQQLAKN